MSETTRNFKEMREMEAADEIRESIKQGAVSRAREYLGNLYEKGQDFAQESGFLGGLNDCYRRLFENAWFGKDIFDGRFQSDTQQLETPYDQRAAFYQLDTPQEQAQEREQDLGNDLER
jgi:hypothetical protein